MHRAGRFAALSAAAARGGDRPRAGRTQQLARRTGGRRDAWLAAGGVPVGCRRGHVSGTRSETLPGLFGARSEDASCPQNALRLRSGA